MLTIAGGIILAVLCLAAFGCLLMLMISGFERLGFWSLIIFGSPILLLGAWIFGFHDAFWSILILCLAMLIVIGFFLVVRWFFYLLANILQKSGPLLFWIATIGTLSVISIHANYGVTAACIAVAVVFFLMLVTYLVMRLWRSRETEI